MVNIVYGCVTNSRERLERYVTPRVGDRSLIVLWNQTSLAHAYNCIIGACMFHDIDALILVHDDLELIDPNTEEKFLTALSMPDAGIVGVAGGYDVTGLAWWNGQTVGHQLTDSGMLDFGPREGDVQSLEGSVMALGPWALDHLCFDEDAFTGFHGYDDIGMTVRQHGKRVIVADIDTHHHTTLGFTSIESEQAWLAADQRFREKWRL